MQEDWDFGDVLFEDTRVSVKEDEKESVVSSTARMRAMILDDTSEVSGTISQGNFSVNHTNRRGKLGFDDFSILKLIGKGGYGKVYQVQHKETKEVYAMKAMKKAFLIKTKNVDGTRAELNIMKKIRHPFIVDLYYAFQTKGKLFLVMEYMNGGQLFFHLRKFAMLSENTARFYAAEVVLALEMLHANDIIHRDLKPENLLLDAEGHVSLTDFGLAKEGMSDDSTTDTFCGTVEYMAPEAIKREAYGKASDWWSFGILLFDMLTGGPPFQSKNRGNLQKQILTAKFRLPQYLSADTHSIIKKLLTRDASARLGTKDNDVKSHPFFKTIHWTKLLNKEVEPPFRPEIQRGKFDVSNFDKALINAPALPSPDVELTNSQQEMFKGFSYARSIEFSPHALEQSL